MSDIEPPLEPTPVPIAFHREAGAPPLLTTDWTPPAPDQEPAP